MSRRNPCKIVQSFCPPNTARLARFRAPSAPAGVLIRNAGKSGLLKDCGEQRPDGWLTGAFWHSRRYWALQCGILFGLKRSYPKKPESARPAPWHSSCDHCRDAIFDFPIPPRMRHKWYCSGLRLRSEVRFQSNSRMSLNLEVARRVLSALFMRARLLRANKNDFGSDWRAPSFTLALGPPKMADLLDLLMPIITSKNLNFCISSARKSEEWILEMKTRKANSGEKKHRGIGKIEIAVSNSHAGAGASGFNPLPLELLKCISQDFDRRRSALGASNRSEKGARAVFSRAEALWVPKIARWPYIERICRTEGAESATKKAIDSIHEGNPSLFGIRTGHNGSVNHANRLAQIVGRLSIQDEILKGKRSGRLSGPPLQKGPPKVAYKTPMGRCVHGTADIALNYLRNKSLKGGVDLIFTSPPFPLNNKKKYGNLQGQEYVDWLASFAPLFRKALKPHGSIVIELGNAWESGHPVMSDLALRALLTFLERGGFYLCQQFVWNNPARLPSPAQWVNVERIRVKDSFTHLWWMSPTTRPKADNRRVLKEYSEAMRELLSRRKYNAGTRPSQHSIGKTSFFTNNGGAIPSNVITLSNTSATGDYLEHCREKKLTPHPARMPSGLVEFFVNFLTEPGDLVLDPFSGSNTTGAAAEKLGRRWVSIEAEKEYIKGSRGRFPSLSTRAKK